MVEKRRGLPTLTLRSLQFPHPWRDFLCARSFRLTSFLDNSKESAMTLSRDDEKKGLRNASHVFRVLSYLLEADSGRSTSFFGSQSTCTRTSGFTHLAHRIS